MRVLQILLLTEEDELYIPLAIDNLLKNCTHTILGIICLKNVTTHSKLKTIKRFISSFGIFPLVKHAVRLIIPKIRDKIHLINNTNRFYSVKRIAQVYQKSYYYVENVNSNEFIDRWKNTSIDLIISISPTQIFKSRLLSLPRYGCINIHTSMLPKYRGLYPVYWAMASGERKIGVSIHYMEKGIDTGDIILQDEISLEGIRTMDKALIKSKLKGSELLLQAINLISEKKVVRKKIDVTLGNYYSFPTKESYKQFRNYGYKLW